jgi:hypothetical protein
MALSLREIVNRQADFCLSGHRFVVQEVVQE